MCGIVGILSDTALGLKEKTALKWLSYFDYVRGRHSTGYIYGDGKENTSLIKRVGSPQELWNDPGAREVFSNDGIAIDNNLRLLVGHNRAATKGAVTTSNAHPFQVKQIIGVHNGTVSHGLQALPDNAKFEVDSEAVFNAIAEGWSLERIDRALYFSFVLVWTDAIHRTLNIARNAQRPLYYCVSKSKKTFCFASEAWMLSSALQVAGLRQDYEDIEFFPANELWTFNFDETNVVSSVIKTKLNFYLPPTNFTGYQGYKGGSDVTRINYYGSSSGGVNWFTPRTQLSKKEFEAIAKDGCQQCNNDIYYSQYRSGALKFLFNVESPICPDCVIKEELGALIDG
jgi:glutamine phosphoribosylpyrophosphate amidotransferase